MPQSGDENSVYLANWTPFFDYPASWTSLLFALLIIVEYRIAANSLRRNPLMLQVFALNRQNALFSSPQKKNIPWISIKNFLL